MLDDFFIFVVFGLLWCDNDNDDCDDDAAAMVSVICHRFVCVFGFNNHGSFFFLYKRGREKEGTKKRPLLYSVTFSPHIFRDGRSPKFLHDSLHQSNPKLSHLASSDPQEPGGTGYDSTYIYPGHRGVYP